MAKLGAKENKLVMVKLGVKKKSKYENYYMDYSLIVVISLGSFLS
jgi:hypothetical protein